MLNHSESQCDESVAAISWILDHF